MLPDRIINIKYVNWRQLYLITLTEISIWQSHYNFINYSDNSACNLDETTNYVQSLCLKIDIRFVGCKFVYIYKWRYKFLSFGIKLQLETPLSSLNTFYFKSLINSHFLILSSV
jgi:hypothetical protein